MNNYFIILGAGKGQRFSQKKPKQFFDFNGKALIDHSIDKALKAKLFKKIVIVISKKHKNYFKKYKKDKILFRFIRFKSLAFSSTQYYKIIIHLFILTKINII